MNSPEPLTLAPASRRTQRDEPRTARDRLQPALFDRLFDEAPQRRKESQDSVMITYTALRQAVLRDLRWLLNTANLESSEVLADMPEVKRSCVNFGLPALAGKRMSEIDWIDMESAIRQAIVDFEPRILRDSVQVTCKSDPRVLDHHNVLTLEIRGLLWCTPYPRELWLSTDIDLETGHMELTDLGAP